MKLSIVIPTRERLAFLTESLKTALAIDSDQVEIVVSDNLSADGTKAALSDISDPRFVYTNTGKRVSMRANFENGLRSTTGDYILFIGDDDGILPGQLGILLDLLEREKPDTLTWPIIRFFWPQLGKKDAGKVRFTEKTVFGQVEEIDTPALKREITTADWDRIDQHPSVYHGIMSRPYLDALRTSDGQFFNCTIPDIFSSFAAILKGGHHLYVAHPFSINGHGPMSNGASQGQIGKQDKTPDIAAQFIAENEVDQNLDVADFGSSLPASMFLSLETAREICGLPPTEVDYGAWFTRLVHEARQMQDAPATVLMDALDAYATRVDAVDALEAAKSQPEQSPSALAKFKKKLASLNRPKRIKFWGAANGENTINTACQICDALLEDDLKAVLAGDMSREQAWRAMVKRHRMLAVAA